MDRTQADILSVIEKKELFEPLRGASVFITGATGLIGSMLMKTLLAADAAMGLGLRLTGQIRDRAKAEAVFGGDARKLCFTLSCDVPCDYIIHTVSPTASRYFIEHPVETIRTSVDSAVSALETAWKNGASLVYLSSMEQYGVPTEPGKTMTEDRSM